jgi:hypothetical protein
MILYRTQMPRYMLQKCMQGASYTYSCSATHHMQHCHLATPITIPLLNNSCGHMQLPQHLVKQLF